MPRLAAVASGTRGFAPRRRGMICALVLMLAMPADLSADSYAAFDVRFILNTSSSMAGIPGARSKVIPHWDSSLRLDPGGEDIQLQIVRATWARIRQESARRSAMFLPPAAAGILLSGPPRQASEPDFYHDVVVKMMRKLFLPSRLGKRRNPPRCRHNPDGPGCG